MKKILQFAGVFLLFVGITFLSGCKSENMDVKKIRDLEFTVVEDADIPEELMKIIESKKKTPCKFTYDTEQYRYIVVGYGEQQTGGYSISVDDLFLTKNAIYLDTNLIGPKKDEVVTQSLSYPYIVVKIEMREEKVYFQ